MWLVGLPASGAAPAGAGEKPGGAKGQALVAELRAAAPAEDVDVQGVIRRRDGQGQRVHMPFRFRTVVGSNGWENIYETPGGSGVAPERLIVRHATGAAPSYRIEGLPSSTNTTTAAPMLLTGDASMVPFAGSDFWLADLGLEYWHWPEHRVVEEARIRMRKGRSCHVLESINPSPTARGYTRVRSWIDRETGKPILAEAYGPDGKLLKEFEIGGVTKVNGVYELKNMEMRNVLTDSRTVLEFRYAQPE